jgi:hypothetical protein
MYTTIRERDFILEAATPLVRYRLFTNTSSKPPRHVGVKVAL